MKLQNAELKEREIVGNMYVYTYVYPKTKVEVKIAKLIPVLKEVIIESDNNEIVLPVVPDRLVITGNNNKVTIVENDELIVPYFLTPEYKRNDNIIKALIKKVLNKK